MKKLLPPQTLLLSVITMLVLNFLYPVLDIIYYPFTLIGVFPLVLGLMISISGSKLFEKIGTNIKTFNKPDKLVTQSLFAYSRNPMYLGFVLLLLGISILLGSLSPFIISFFYFMLLNNWYIPFEEKCCEETLGEEYLAYKSIVRRWI